MRADAGVTDFADLEGKTVLIGKGSFGAREGEKYLKLFGLEGKVGTKYSNLSGGQKQRLALDRALLNQTKVLVLDDPLSAVDAKTEAAILEALDRAKSDRTFVLITNRVAAAARTDHVVVLDEGRIVERGTHAERTSPRAAICVFRA